MLMDDGNEPATKADLNALRADMNAIRDEVIEALHGMEARLIKAFNNFAESNERWLSDNERSAA